MQKTFDKLKSYCIYLLLIIMGNAQSAYSQENEVRSDNIQQYTLDSGDLIEISVFGQDDLTVETRLSNTGVINYPFLGDINLVGLTLTQVETLIDSGLRGDYLVNPSVSVKVKEYRPFFIDGEVERPGGYPYQPGLSISKAAALAGGFTERAVKNAVVIVRTIGGVEQTIKATEKDIVFPGDIITVQQRFF